MFYCGAARLATTAATCMLPVVPRCGAACLAAAAAAACAPPVMLPSGGCASCCAVVLPTSPPPPPPVRRLSCCAVVLPTSPPLPARCLPCRRRAVACRAALWCCLPRHRCLRAACRVTVGRLRVMPRCGAARIAAAACALAAVDALG